MGKITALTAEATVVDADIIPVVDVSDTTQSANGSTNKVTLANFAAGAPFTSRYAARPAVDGTVGQVLTILDDSPFTLEWADGGGGSGPDLSANGKGYINHGATAGTARPTGFASIEWHGTVEPSNAVDGDTWIDTT
jgi:hypothetical protein